MILNNEKPDECEGCQYETGELAFCGESYGQQEQCWLCEVCRGSPAGSAATYPTVSTYRDIRPVLQQVAYGTNLVLAALRKPQRQ